MFALLRNYNCISFNSSSLEVSNFPFVLHCLVNVDFLLDFIPTGMSRSSYFLQSVRIRKLKFCQMALSKHTFKISISSEQNQLKDTHPNCRACYQRLPKPSQLLETPQTAMQFSSLIRIEIKIISTTYNHCNTCTFYNHCKVILEWSGFSITGTKNDPSTKLLSRHSHVLVYGG